MTAMIILEDAVIARLARDQAIVSEFPFLGSATAGQPAATTKKSCCGKKNRPVASNYAAIRHAIGNLSKERKSRLKQLLGAQQVRVYFQNERNQRVKLTF